MFVRFTVAAYLKTMVSYFEIYLIQLLIADKMPWSIDRTSADLKNILICLETWLVPTFIIEAVASCAEKMAMNVYKVKLVTIKWILFLLVRKFGSIPFGAMFTWPFWKPPSMRVATQHLKHRWDAASKQWRRWEVLNLENVQLLKKTFFRLPGKCFW